VKVLSADNIGFSVNGSTLLHGVDLHLQQGELLGLIGPNGAGKSTLLRIITGLVEGFHGEVTLQGKPLGEMPLRNRARELAYLAQEGVAHWPLRVERLVELGRLPHLESWRSADESDRAVVSRVMQQTDTYGIRHRTYDTLSGGERMRVLLARALAVEPGILLADEPVANLDPAHQLEVMALLREHCDAGGAAIVVLHDLSLAAHYCHRLQLLHNGRTVAAGGAAEVLCAENLRQVYGIRGIGDGYATLRWERADQ
jgi:iron complex transport system ATP-binding protein